MKKSGLVYGLSALCVVLLAVCVMQQRTINCLKSGACGGSKAVSICGVQDDAEVSVATDVKSCCPGEKSAASERAAAQDPLIPPTPVLSQDAEEGQGMEKFFEGMSEMMKSPEMKDALLMQQRAAIQMTYKDLMSYLQLVPEDRESFENLLVEKHMAAMDGGLRMMDSSLSAEERSATSKELKALNDRYNERIKDFLGDEDYAVYDEFERTQPERMQVEQFKQRLSSEEALSNDQEHELILMMHETRTNFQYSVDMERLETDPSMLNEEAVESLIVDFARIEQAYLVNAEGLLDDAQFDAYESALQQQRTMQETGMRMALKMFSGAGKEQ